MRTHQLSLLLTWISLFGFKEINASFDGSATFDRSVGWSGMVYKQDKNMTNQVKTSKINFKKAEK